MEIVDLVFRVAERITPPRVVTPDEYRAIACNRCGDCCEDIRTRFGPEELDSSVDDPSVDGERRRFFAGLIAVGPVPGGWRYRCRHFSRDIDGLGLCGVHEDRPAVCRWFPGGHVVRSWSRCAWNVEVRDERGAVLSFVPNVREGRGSPESGPSAAPHAPTE